MANWHGSRKPPGMTRRFSHACFAAAILLPAALFDSTARAQSASNRDDESVSVARLFEPWLTNLAALAPDGAHVAYPVRQNDGSDELVIAGVDDASEPVEIDLSRAGGPGGVVRVRRLLWVTATDLAFETSANRILTVRADGAGLRVLLTPEQAGYAFQRSRATRRRAQPRVALGFDLVNGPAALPPPILGAGRSPGAPRAPSPLIAASGSALDDRTAPIDQTGALLSPTQSQPEGTAPRPLELEPSLPGEPDSIWVEAKGWDSADPDWSVPTSLYRVPLAGPPVETWNSGQAMGDVLYDREGRGRVMLDGANEDRRTFVESSVVNSKLVWRDLPNPFGSPAPFTVTPDNYAGERTMPLQFGADANLLYCASNAGRDTFALYALDLPSGRQTWSLQEPGIDLVDLDWNSAVRSLVFDRAGKLAGIRYIGLDPEVRWFDPALAGVQTALERRFPRRFVELDEWDDAKARFLVLVTSDSDPGRYYIYDRASDELTQIARRAPDLSPARVSRSFSLSLTTGSGTALTGYLTLPSHPRGRAAPLVVICHDGPWDRFVPGFHREAQAFAAAGFAVWEPNYRGSSGFGLAFREALSEGIDRIPLTDVMESVEWLASRYPVDPNRLGLYGRGFGGYLAIRALQLYPSRVEGVVAIDAPVDLPAWRNAPQAKEVHRKWVQDLAIEDYGDMQSALGGDPSFGLDTDRGMGPWSKLDEEEQTALYEASMSHVPRPGVRAAPDPGADVAAAAWREFLGRTAGSLAEISPRQHPESIGGPLLLIEDPDDDPTAILAPGRRLAQELARRGAPFKYAEIRGACVRITPESALETVSLASDFFNLVLYHYHVKLGRPYEVLPRPGP